MCTITTVFTWDFNVTIHLLIDYFWGTVLYICKGALQLCLYLFSFKFVALQFYGMGTLAVGHCIPPELPFDPYSVLINGVVLVLQ